MFWQYQRHSTKKGKIHPKNFAQPKNGLYIPQKSAESSFFKKNVFSVWLYVAKYLLYFIYVLFKYILQAQETSQIGISKNNNLISIH